METSGRYVMIQHHLTSTTILLVIYKSTRAERYMGYLMGDDRQFRDWEDLYLSTVGVVFGLELLEQEPRRSAAEFGTAENSGVGRGEWRARLLVGEARLEVAIRLMQRR